jgi:imidazolonepropionase-like amidohydrolase
MHHARLALGLLWLTGALAVHAETVMIEADGYVDVVAGRIVSPGIVVVEGDRIAAVNPATKPAGARTIALPGHTLIPGLMDAHTNLN